MVNDNQDDQSSVNDNQDYEINIDKIYTDYIKEIDAIRSYVNVSNPNNINFFNNLTIESVTSIINKLKVEDTPQESRCHAFFRLIGLPVVRNGGENFYSPGLDNIKENSDINKKNKFQSKLDIANDQIKGFDALSSARESYFLNLKRIFSKTQTVEASVLALSSSSYVRNFSDPLDKFGNERSTMGTVVDDDLNSKSFNVFDMNLENQSYDLRFNLAVGINSFPLQEFVDITGKKIITNSFDYLALFRKQHIVAPYIVDPKIDFSVSPAKSKIAVPFVNSKQNLKISEVDFVKRPLIEKIIKERLFIEQNLTTSAGTNFNIINSYIRNLSSISNDELVKQVSQKDIYGLGEQLQFLKYINIIRTMCVELVKAQNTIKFVQNKYYWLPISTENGPEFPNGSQKIFAFQTNSDDAREARKKFITQEDKFIINQQLIVSVNELNAQARQLNGTADIGGYSFDGVETVFDTSNSNSPAYGSAAADSLKELSETRDKRLNKASQALRTVEIIMGEFSGLGFCDIIAVLGALYTIPKSSLIGLIDDNAYERMKNDRTLDGTITRNSVSVSLYDLSTKTKEFYDIMDKIYLDTSSKNLRS